MAEPQPSSEQIEIERQRPFIEAQTALAISGIKNLILINGAAAIALLAFLGHAKESGAGIPSHQLPAAMMVFGYGVLASGFCGFLAYLFQTTNREFRIKWLDHSLRVAAILAAFGGLVCFFIGLQLSACAFSQ